MSLTLQELESEGAIEVLAYCFDSEAAAIAILAKVKVKIIFLPKFGEPNPIYWWQTVCKKMELGMGGEDSLQLLMEAALEIYPGNKIFGKLCGRSPLSQPVIQRETQGINIELKISGNVSSEALLVIMQTIQIIAQDKGGNALINLGYPGSSCVEVTFENLSHEQVQEALGEFKTTCEERGATAEFTERDYHFRDYFTDPIELEGPDGQRFAADQIRASTTVGDIARGLVNQYTDSGIWPNSQGQRTHAVVDRLLPDGSHQRLDPRVTLHDAGVRPNDVLIISPERTAGNIHPMLREAALARVRNEVLAYAQTHQGFEVQANSLVAPTEYIFHFSAWGFAPPKVEGGTPIPINTHAVLIWLSPNFPVHAPEAWWQTDIFHPNIEPKSGAVCLGALKDHYRPAMDFGELCQMLIDLAGYRNYATAEGYNTQAQLWASSLDGQIAIEAIGGISNIGKMMLDQAAKRPLKIRRLQP